MLKTQVVVIGGGAAGLLACATAAQNGLSVLLIERNARLGRKLMITGKGRCNITNDCDIETFISNIPVNSRFMFSAIHQFTPQDTQAFFEEIGVPVKVERGNRVFPISDKAVDVVDALSNYIKKFGVVVITGRAISLGHLNNKINSIVLESGQKIECETVIICTGGLSYPITGSTGDGYRLAEQAGHKIIPPKPSLVPIECKEKWCKELQGLSLRNIEIRLKDKINDKIIYEDFGELLFTHFGLTGPVILSASSHIRKFDAERYAIEIDLKPALTMEMLDLRIQRDFAKNLNRDFGNSLNDLLPKSIIPVIIALSEIDPMVKVNQITKEMRQKLCSVLKSLPITIKALRPIDEAIITSGGVDVTQINPKTMESKLVKGLYFAGEVLDVDAYTGGFNLQIAFSTGRLAGNSVNVKCTM
jgi:predicted Rossmann fold flavoprotein